MTTPIQTTARDRLERLSAGLAQALGPEPAARLLAGAALNALLATLGRDGAAKYLRLLADEVDDGLPPDDVARPLLS
jgi:hypothetical protein